MPKTAHRETTEKRKSYLNQPDRQAGLLATGSESMLRLEEIRQLADDKLKLFIKKRPFATFFIALALLFLVILIGNIFGQPQTQKAAATQPKPVSIYAIGEAPKVTFQGKIAKAGIIKITALAGGVVQSIDVNEGDKVYAGTQILSLSSNYQGGNAPAIQAQLAQTQYKNLKDTYDEQTDLINKQKDIAKKTNENSVDLQNLNATASTESASLINSSQDYLNSVNQSLTDLQALNQASPSAATQQQIQQLPGTINQLQGGLNQLKQSQRQLAYQADGNQPPAELANLQKDITLQQLDIQQKALELNKEVSKLQAELAQVNAAAMFPASPFAGTVQRIYIRAGQSVSPGTVLATIASSTIHTTVEVSVPENIAKNLSQLEPSTLYLGTNTYSIKPTFVSTEATDGNLYTIVYTIPENENSITTDGSYTKVELPVGAPSTGAAVPFVPIDAIYQSQESSYLLIDNKGTAETRQVTLGQIYGSYVEITTGLKSGDQIILDRNVVAGDKVK